MGRYLLYTRSGTPSDGGGSGGASGVLGAHAAAPQEGLHLHGGVAQEDDEEQVEGGAEQGAHKVGGDAPGGGHLAPVQAVVGVGVALLSATQKDLSEWRDLVSG